MNYFKLLVFCKLSELKKGTEVAKVLNITASTVSFHIQSLEKELGVQLFYRKMGNFILTSQGEIIFGYAKRIVHLQDELLYFAQSNHQGVRGTFRIGVSGLANQIFVPEIIHSFSTDYPQIQLSVTSSTSPEIEEMVANFELDYGILIGSPKKHPELNYVKIGNDRLKLVFGNNHSFNKKESIQKADILNQKILFHEKQSSSKSLLEQWLGCPITDLNRIELDSITTMKKILEYGQTIAFISEYLVQEELADHSLASKDLSTFELTRTIYLVRNKEVMDNAIGENFKRKLHKITEKLELGV